jgi:AbrB family looped-hinge helix DNA binding protein
MTQATMTSKGQMTIPKEVRDRLNLKPGDRLDIQVQDDGTARMVPKTIRLRSLAGMVKRRSLGVSVADMNEGVAAHVSEHVMRSLGRRRK